MKYQDIKDKYSENYNSIMEEHKVFWAFSSEQLEEGKKKIGISDNKLLTSFGMGGFMPKANADKMFKLLAEETKRYKKELKEAKEATKEAIKYELSNYECYYTGEIDDVVEKFKGTYTAKDIRKVYEKERYSDAVLNNM